MPRDGSQTKTSILNHAEKLFRERSYSGFSYNDISRPLGIKNAAIHYHFPSKGDLGVAILERYRRLLARMTRATPKTGEQAEQQLRTLFDFEARLGQDGNRVCPLAVLATDYANTTPHMQQTGEQLVGELIGWLAQVLEIGRRDGNFDFRGEPRRKAAEICAAFVGARQMARLAREDLFAAVADQIRNDLKRAS